MSNRSKKGQPGQTKKRNRGLLSCLECHRRKQKCDRERPCGDCVERGVPEKCMYQITNNPKLLDQVDDGTQTISRLKRIMTGEEVILTTESVYALDGRAPTVLTPHPMPYATSDIFPNLDSRILNARRSRSSFLQTLTIRPKSPNVASGLYYTPPLLRNFDPFSLLPEMEGEPVPKQLLIRYYLERVAPWVCYLDDEMPTDESPRIAWLPFALEHKPFFCATLLMSAVHLNRKRPFKDPAVLLWFKAETIRAANEKRDEPTQAASDEMIMVALILLVFNVGGGNSEEFEIHLKGINEMVKLRGGLENLGMRGMVRNWLEVCHGPWHSDFEYGHFS